MSHRDPRLFEESKTIPPPPLEAVVSKGGQAVWVDAADAEGVRREAFIGDNVVVEAKDVVPFLLKALSGLFRRKTESKPLRCGTPFLHSQ